MKQVKDSLTIGWLYPDLMSTYGDRGNIIVLQKRCHWRGIEINIIPINQETTPDTIASIDLLFGGGSQDIQQEIVIRDLKGEKTNIIKRRIEENMPALFVCGSPQIMGHYYEPAFGKKIEGLGIFDIETVNPGKRKPRCIGNIIASVYWENLAVSKDDTIIVGFENHGGRTYLGSRARPFAKVLKGYGNNGEDGTEGVVYRNAIGCYFHGPLLPKNPLIADHLISRALTVKYKRVITLPPLSDALEYRAAQIVIKRFNS